MVRALLRFFILGRTPVLAGKGFTDLSGLREGAPDSRILWLWISVNATLWPV